MAGTRVLPFGPPLSNRAEELAPPCRREGHELRRSLCGGAEFSYRLRLSGHILDSRHRGRDVLRLDRWLAREADPPAGLPGRSCGLHGRVATNASAGFLRTVRLYRQDLA